ncbi:MAG: pyridine nucleotide-disulfide oxidoreductase [Rhodospirillales bacterium]|nr:pyridine nucleotide-disulfide oxidoreductase [Rhodospirillales bacterium]
MAAVESLVVIGAGHAAGQLVACLAQDGFAGAITLVGDEPHPPYQRPPLSKKFLAGEMDADRLYLKPAAFYDKYGAKLLLGRRVTRIDRQARTAVLEDGSQLEYSALVIATGSRPRRLALPGAELDGVFYLRGIDDVMTIRGRFAAGKSLVVVGGGYIGLELAAVAVRQGLRVSVLEQAPRLMARGVGAIVSRFYERLHREEGVVLHTGAAVLGFEGRNAVEHVVCGNDRVVADIVVIGAGAVPNVELAQEAGLTVENGIVVNERCLTGDPAIYAIGDCTNQFHPLFDRRLRFESVHNALEQARMVAAAICGRALPAIQVPWFWSDQYDVKLQMAGLPDKHTESVVRGNPDHGRCFSVFYLADGALIAVEAVNRAADFMMSKVLIAERAHVDRAKLADERVAVKDSRLV